MLSSLKAHITGWRSFHARWSAVVLVGMLGLAVAAMQLGPTPTAGASAGLHYQRGHYLTNGWYCYGWASGAYHCTRQWHRSGTRIISDNPSWVPNSGSNGSTGGVSHQRNGGGGGGVSQAPAGIGQWVRPRGYYAYRMSSQGWYSNLFGYCTWYAAYRHKGEPLMQLGNARYWAANAPRHGLATGSAPRVGATAVFQPGVQGAGGGGHVAHVEKVYSNGWFLVSEMNFYWNGGGFGRVSYRYAHAGAGVRFIY